MRRPGDEVGDADRRLVDAGSNETSDVSDVREVVGVYRLGDVLDAFPFDDARVRRVPRNDDIGIEFLGLFGECIVVDVPRVGVHVVLFDLVRLPREVRRVAVRQVAAVGEFKERISSPGSRTPR